MANQEDLIREAYAAGRYAADWDEGKVWKRRESDPDPSPPETVEQVVRRLVGDVSEERR